MKTSLLTLLILSAGLSSLDAQACSCSSTTWPLDTTEAVIAAARRAGYAGRSTKVEEKDLNLVRTYPSLREKLNLDGFKGTSCEVHGPNGESHFYCSSRSSEDYEVTVHRYNGDCKVIIHAKATLTKVKVSVVENHCEKKEP